VEIDEKITLIQKIREHEPTERDKLNMQCELMKVHRAGRISTRVPL
jgi:hypothetical protein